MTIYDSITETIGETPLVRLNRINPPGTHVYVKIERGNPAGSIKDRAALSMINDAVARGVLEEGGTIIEPTSGNTGIAIAMIAAARGYKAVIVMPDTMSKERISLMKAYGAEVVLSPGAKGMQGAVELAESPTESGPGRRSSGTSRTSTSSTLASEPGAPHPASASPARTAAPRRRSSGSSLPRARS